MSTSHSKNNFDNSKVSVLKLERSNYIPLVIFFGSVISFVFLRKWGLLRAVFVNELANSLQIELGLHISTCQSISTAWSKSINLARQSRQWQNSVELDKLLAITLAPQMENCMQEEFAQRIVPEHDRDKLSRWVESVKNQTIRVDSTLSGRKRPPTGDPEGAPPAKEARI